MAKGLGSLKRSLKGISSNKGGKATQADRFGMLMLFATQLHEMKYKINNAKSIKPKHVDALVERWKSEGLKHTTICNRMSILRHWANAVDKASIIKPTNAEYGLRRDNTYRDRAIQLTPEHLAKIDCEYTKLSVRLQQEFGLRRETAIKFNPGIADMGDHIALQASWTKGAVPGIKIPVTNQAQRALLNEIHSLVGNSSLIPEGKTYKQQRNIYDTQNQKSGLKNPHGLRHKRAQNRIQELISLGASPEVARKIVSRELGHSRIEITYKYTGKKAA